MARASDLDELVERRTLPDNERELRGRIRGQRA